MGELSRFERAVLGLTAAFVLFTGCVFLISQPSGTVYQVTTTQRRPEEPAASGVEADAWPDSLLPGERIDLNTADVYDLQRLPGIGERRAEDIVAYRTEHGAFDSLERLDEIPGIGPATIDGLWEYATVG